MKYVIHLLLFKISWGACVFGALYGATRISFLVSVTCLTLAILLTSPKRRIDFLKVALVLPLGIGFEYINELLPLYSFVPDTQSPPGWMLCFWPAFAILFIETLEFLYDRNIVIQFLFGFAFGAGYWAGEYLGLIQFQGNKVLSMGLFAALWSLQFLLILRVTKYIDRKFTS